MIATTHPQPPNRGPRTTGLRTRWAAIGAAVAVSAGASGIGFVNAATSSGERSISTVITACRVADTRNNQAIGAKIGAFGPGETHTVKVAGTNGQCSLPGDITAVDLNVTAVGATEPTHLTVWDSGPVPNASSLNPAPGQPPTPNAVTVKVASGGTFNVYNRAGNVHLIIDVVGVHQDHNHDDRYYTKDEVDQKVSGSGGEPGPRGPEGPAGPQGHAGPQGPAGADGIDGQRGSSAWDIIPPGVTVTGTIAHSTAGTYPGQIIAADLPGVAPTPLASENVRLAPSDLSVVNPDPTCSGTSILPTAPPGKLCVYIDSSANAGRIVALPGPLLRRSFIVSYSAVDSGAGSMWLTATWAYTAPDGPVKPPR